MSYRLKLKEPLAKGVRRIAVQQLEIADKRLAEPEGAASAVHEARKALKRTRALLRLVRPALGDGRFKRENRRLAEIGRQLSGARDREVVLGVLAGLSGEDTPRGRAAAALARVMSSDGADAAVPETVVGENVRAALAKAKSAISKLELPDGGWGDITEGLIRSYKSGRKALAYAEADPSAVEPLHDLRKACQTHWRQMLLLQRAWPEMLSMRAAAAKEVSQILGDDHDIELLAAALERYESSLDETDRDALLAFIEARHKHLREAGLFKAHQLFSEKPRHFARQVAELWEVARTEPPPEAPQQVGQSTKVERKTSPRRTKATTQRKPKSSTAPKKVDKDSVPAARPKTAPPPRRAAAKTSPPQRRRSPRLPRSSDD